ncbi:recombinase family protein [Candidatus Cetobacterium colombiensis]|uniref:Recombinase family protein n=1 Tax=Candidatus Cetobacterium colombiensis TaxID=3073100 RepID=A0ABU4WAL0_9FUSO|nr:recombinase family protein [Candidatus Cetobacterium colombiensis]MDX8336572.1 recombinase family protein [Candidatus Cetobacterium colombiensis]
MVYGYCRVSTKKQSLSRQVDVILDYGVKYSNIYMDTYTGAEIKRKGLDKLREILTKGDTLVVKEIDRLGRNRSQTIDLIKELIERDINLIVLDTPYLQDFIIRELKNNEGFMEIMANTLLALILEVAEQERKKILLRTSEGKKKAIAKGVKFGRKTKITKEIFLEYYNKIKEGIFTPKDIQESLNISKQSYYNYIKKYVET